MPSIIGVSDSGTLTGSGADTIVTAAADSLEETAVIMVRNASGSDRTITVYVNGTATANIIGTPELADGYTTVIKCALAANDVVYLEASGSNCHWNSYRRRMVA